MGRIGISATSASHLPLDPPNAAGAIRVKGGKTRVSQWWKEVSGTVTPGLEPSRETQIGT